MNINLECGQKQKKFETSNKDFSFFHKMYLNNQKESDLKREKLGSLSN